MGDWRPTSTQLAAMRAAAANHHWYGSSITGRSLQTRGMFQWTRHGYVLTLAGKAVVTAMAGTVLRKSARQLVLELDPRARLDGPKFIGHYKTYAVYSGSGEEIGYTDGNEDHPSFAWSRALATLRKRVKP